MKKSKHVLDSHDKNYPDKLLGLEGVVKFSHRDSASELTLKFENFNRGDILVRGVHRIDVGEKVRIHYSSRCTSAFFIVKAYEILCEDGSVKFRYSDMYCEFVDL